MQLKDSIRILLRIFQYKSGFKAPVICICNYGGFWSLDPPPATQYQWRTDFAIKQEFCNDASTLYKMTIPKGSSLSGLEGTVGTQGMGLYGGAHQVYIDYKAVPSDWIKILPTNWK